MAKNTKIVVENRQRDIKNLGVVKVGGKKYGVKLGSADDTGKKLDHETEFAPPKVDYAIDVAEDKPVPLTQGIWEAFMERKAVQAWVEESAISVYGA